MKGETSQERPRQQPEVETHVLPDGTCLLFDNRTEMGHVLNAIGALVWDYCDGTLTVDQIAGEIAGLLPEQPLVRDDVARLIAELRTLDLLQSPSRDTLIHTGVLGVPQAASAFEAP